MQRSPRAFTPQHHVQTTTTQLPRLLAMINQRASLRGQRMRQWARLTRYVIVVEVAALRHTIGGVVDTASDQQSGGIQSNLAQAGQKRETLEHLQLACDIVGSVARSLALEGWNPPCAFTERIHSREAGTRRCTTKNVNNAAADGRERRSRSPRPKSHWTTIGQHTHWQEREPSRPSVQVDTSA